MPADADDVAQPHCEPLDTAATPVNAPAVSQEPATPATNKRSMADRMRNAKRKAS